ncbi:MAG: transcription-repair coupling factor [Acidobacteria bacterium]|nr:transcription-repair coupling factor [Acidobacteriota bacterium]
MSTATSLSLRSLLSAGIGRAGLGPPAQRVSGLSAAARALAVSAVAHASAEAVVLYVVPTDAELDAAVSDIGFFLGALEGLADATLERHVLPLPAHQVDPYRGLAPHFRVAAARARALSAAASGSARVIVASGPALLPRLAEPEVLVAASFDARPGVDIDPHALAAVLVDAGYQRQDPVDAHGEFSLRGGILDVFPAGEPAPIRIEFVGDTIESIRRFDPSTQRSIETLDQFEIQPVREPAGISEAEPSAARSATVIDYLRASKSATFVVSEPDDVRSQVERWTDQVAASFEERSAQTRLPAPGQLLLGWSELERALAGALVLEELATDASPDPSSPVHVPCQPAQNFHGRIQDWVADIRQARERGDTVLLVADTHGRAERMAELLGDYEIRAIGVSQADDLSANAVLIAEGWLSRGFRLPTAAVHGDVIQEFLELRYHGEDKLFVPVERLDLVQKYTGGTRPPLDRLGGTSWEKAKKKVKKAMRDMAEELLKLYAARRAMPGHAFSADTHWQQEFEDAFEWDLTADQATAISEIKRDMESPTPMDRLLCGDVGYGKTEVAMRAAFKAVMDGKQVAVLAPTTVLAAQHLETLRRRFAAFPAKIDMVSRFRTKQEIKEALDNLVAGRLDVIVGTHRLLSKDVVFRDLGLLVVDEEQRFGVAHKERIKQIRRKVDVLTMTATPIPRTLNMSLVGIRDMSVIETPPKDRLAIQTNVVKFDAQVIARAIRQELARAGQVYFVHNRVESIFSMGNLLQRLVPEARIVVGHGQMGDEQLERAMLGFMAQEFDILLATTIVENGLDIPNANTIVINRADRYGLSQLYQLRGRVGRSDRAAYAYLLIPPEESLSPVARKRLSAIKEFSDLGSGFRVAALDLEIRGAGNLLGGEQSGQIDAVGFEMYMKLLEETIRELKGEDLEDDVRAVVNLKVDFRIDQSYIADMNQRLSVYRRIAAARSEEELAQVMADLRDRYGPLPLALLNLADYARIRVMADALGVESIDREGSVVVFKFREKTRIDPGARATTGEVKPGFSKAVLTAVAPDDPRKPDGLLERVTSLLDALRES